MENLEVEKMQTALRKMGNSTGMIVPRAILGEMGLSVGAALDLTVEDGRVVATPVTRTLRAGWEEAAEEIGRDEPVDHDWLGFGNAGDVDLEW